ncbi:MAG: 23S rRNA (adenine(2503)-C(2))-methyltransferase RlmN [Planctomycetes bacterium]|nr:23S rRNA (adenine(2503)-C(2))-methyltransferase RlmN [Planctomycetota bacterium]
MDILGLTFRQVVEAIGPRPHQVRALRAAYRELVNGRPLASHDADPGLQTPKTDRLEAGPTRGWPLRADILPVVRTHQDGELTKFVQRTHDGLETESVVVPMERYGRSWKTLCVSSQVGCARGCTFCETAQLGLLRNLTPGEIDGQVTAARRAFGRDVRNIVFMGMGEPFDNFDNVMQAIDVLTDRSGLSFSAASIAVSTVGRIQGIRRLAALGRRRLNVAVSLNAPNDEIRSRIMPISRTDPMPALRDALLDYPLRKCQFFMIEYVLIPGVNDAREHAVELAEFLRPVKCVVNVIPYNPRRDSPWPAPSEKSVVNFMTWLQDAGQMCKRRLTKGRDHMAACGQLGNRAIARIDRARDGSGEPMGVPSLAQP